MASKNQSHHSRKEDKAKPKEATMFQRYVQRPLSSLRSRLSSSPRSESGSDDADIPFYHEGRVKRHGWMQFSIFSEPKMLIDTDGSGQFVICNETIMQISRISWKLVIVGIAGPYRCGKSFLMNRLAGKSKGFFVGNSTDAATKGIWAWCQIHPTQEETVLILLDTEGLGDIHKGDKNHDNKLLTLITLLCNVLIFNMMGRFDEDSISKLSFATQISKLVTFGSDHEERNCLPIVMPELILCLRDFFLQLSPGIVTPDMYFEDCLKEVKGKDEYNAPRQSLKTFFPRRHCFTFPVPADDDSMNCLENVKKEKLKISFLQKADEFSKHIFNCKPKKMIDSDFSVDAHIDGSIFKGLLEYHVECTRQGIIPDIEAAFFTVSRNENERIMKEAKDEFNKTIDGIGLPVDSLNDVQDKVLTAIENCLEKCRKRMIMDKDNKQEKQLQSDLHKIWDAVKADNSRLLQKQFVERLIMEYSGSFKETSSTFLKENGYEEYKNKLNQMKMGVENSLPQSLQSEFSLAWSVFMNRIRDDEMLVLESDKNLTKAQRERRIQELTDQHYKALQEQAAKSKKILDDEVERLSKLQIERDKRYADQLNEIREELLKFKGLGVWERVKFVFTGTVDD